MVELGALITGCQATEGKEDHVCLRLRLLREEKVWRFFVAGRGGVGHVPLLAKRAFACDSSGCSLENVRSGKNGR